MDGTLPRLRFGKGGGRGPGRDCPEGTAPIVPPNRQVFSLSTLRGGRGGSFSPLLTGGSWGGGFYLALTPGSWVGEDRVAIQSGGRIKMRLILSPRPFLTR